jgi:SHS2 domain-containing protein
MKIDFEVLSHTADIKIRVHGSTLEELFKNALVGMFQSIGPRAVGCRIANDRLVCPSLPVHHTIEIEAFDTASLLVDFLSEALFLSDLNSQAYLDVTIHEITPTHVVAKLHGIQITGFEVAQIKGVTYHNLKLKEVPEGFEVDIVFDV